jgi:hypothetical protein
MAKKLTTRYGFPPRKPPEFTVSIKLWVSPDMYEWLATQAQEQEWSIPQVIRRAIRDAQAAVLAARGVTAGGVPSPAGSAARGVKSPHPR